MFRYLSQCYQIFMLLLIFAKVFNESIYTVYIHSTYTYSKSEIFFDMNVCVKAMSAQTFDDKRKS